jgi:hypothetical protein
VAVVVGETEVEAVGAFLYDTWQQGLDLSPLPQPCRDR